MTLKEEGSENTSKINILKNLQGTNPGMKGGEETLSRDQRRNSSCPIHDPLLCVRHPGGVRAKDVDYVLILIVLEGTSKATVLLLHMPDQQTH